MEYSHYWKIIGKKMGIFQDDDFPMIFPIFFSIDPKFRAGHGLHASPAALCTGARPGTRGDAAGGGKHEWRRHGQWL